MLGRLHYFLSPWSLFAVGSIAVACSHPKAARSPADEQLLADVHRARGKSLRDFCERGDPLACGFLGALISDVRDQETKTNERGNTLLEKGCAANEAYSCASLGRVLRFGSGDVSMNDSTRGYELVHKSCAAGLDLCRRGRYSHDDTQRAYLDYFSLHCQNDPVACFSAGQYLIWWEERGERHEEDDYARAADLFARGCGMGFLAGCDYAAYLYSGREGVAADRAKGVALARAACTGGDRVGCRFVTQVFGEATSAPAPGSGAASATPPVAVSSPLPAASATPAANPSASPTTGAP